MTLTSLTCVHNAASTLPRLFESIAWIEDKRVLDLGSTDDSASVAERHGATVSPRLDGQALTDAIDACLEGGRHEWILVLEAKDYLAANAEDEVRRLIETFGGDCDGFEIPRYSEIAGHVMRGAAWYPGRQTRLFRRGAGRWVEAGPGRPVVQVAPNRCRRLEPPDCLHVHHLEAASLRDLIAQRCHVALDGEADGRAGPVAFEEYVGAAYAQLAAADAQDGDLGHAVATVLAWEQIVRGLAQWDRVGQTRPLAPAFSLPIETMPYRSEVLVPEQLLRRIHDLEAQVASMQTAWQWNASRMIGRIRAVVTRVRPT